MREGATQATAEKPQTGASDMDDTQTKNRKTAVKIDNKEGVARIDMALGLASVFRPRCGKRRLYIDGGPQPWCGGHIAFSGPELDAGDLLVLLALLRLGGGGQITKGTDELFPSGARANTAREMDIVKIETTLTTICTLIGGSGGSGHRKIRVCLKRLAAIVVEIEGDGLWGATHLIQLAATRNDRLHVQISGRLTKAILGVGSFGRIRVDQVRVLTPVARVLLLWLTCWFGGATRPRAVHIDRLATHVWGVLPSGTTAHRRRQRQLIRAALNDISKKTSWSAVVEKSLIRITPGAHRVASRVR